VGEIYRLLASGTSKKELERHLIAIEISRIGVSTSEEQRQRTIEKLLTLNISISD
jgi:hypothetical protein